jgi:succinate-semialdehyde dehydrogenase/glutarate-semialdehyde dehydrogenase
MKAIFESYVQGDPMDDDTMIGPVVSESALKELQKQIKESVDKGAEIITGGERVGDKGFYLQPTILSNVTPEVPSYHEEIFGPVASIIKVDSDEEAIKVANDTRFGLGASLYTQDIEKAKRLIPQIEAGCVFVNQLVKSDPRLPFGGIKKSGVGRELSAEGAQAFTNIKTVWIQ